MIIHIIIESHKFETNCGISTQEVAWLVLCACNLYGQGTYPIEIYCPMMAKKQAGTIIFPKIAIVKNMVMISEKIYVEVRKK